MTVNSEMIHTPRFFEVGGGEFQILTSSLILSLCLVLHYYSTWIISIRIWH